jgi:XRE family transcriptional regulator, regulator of sulfur utilization
MTELPATDPVAETAPELGPGLGPGLGSPATTAESITAAIRIGQRVSSLRHERGLSLGELAGRAGIGKATLSGVEAGTRNPTLETLYAITGELGLPLAAVLAEPEPEPQSAGIGAVHGDTASVS